jgi:uridine kinase
MVAPDAARAGVLEQVADQIVVVERPHPIRVAIDGRTAAGKTILADELVAPIERLGRPAIRVQIDDFHQPRAERRRRQEIAPPDRYYLDSYDYSAIRTMLLLPLGPTGNRCYCRALFDSFHDVPYDEPERVAPPDAVVLVDGVFLSVLC